VGFLFLDHSSLLAHFIYLVAHGTTRQVNLEAKAKLNQAGAAIITKANSLGVFQQTFQGNILVYEISQTRPYSYP
jgi:hypothetical protein